MSFNLANVRWGWVLLGALIAWIVAYGSTFVVVTGYATYLGFQAKGTPDRNMINEFADHSAEGIMSTFILVGALIGGWLAGRKAKAEALKNGLLVGLISALFFLVLGLIGTLKPWTLVGFALSIAGGWIGGRIAERKRRRAVIH